MILGASQSLRSVLGFGTVILLLLAVPTVTLFGLDVPKRRFTSSKFVGMREHQLRPSDVGEATWTVAEVRRAMRGWVALLRERHE